MRQSPTFVDRQNVVQSSILREKMKIKQILTLLKMKYIKK